MPKSFNIGRDVSVDIVDPQLGVIRFAIRTGWTSTPITDDLASKALDGVPRHAAIPNGHRLTMELDRADPNVSNYFALLEERYFSGGENDNVSITETITEVGGSITEFRYTDVALKQTNAGTWRGNTITTMGLEGMASRKRKIQ